MVKYWSLGSKVLAFGWDNSGTEMLPEEFETKKEMTGFVDKTPFCQKFRVFGGLSF